METKKILNTNSFTECNTGMAKLMCHVVQVLLDTEVCGKALYGF